VPSIKPLLQSPHTLKVGRRGLPHGGLYGVRRSIYEASFVKVGPLGNILTTRSLSAAVSGVAAPGTLGGHGVLRPPTVSRRILLLFVSTPVAWNT
jgi:hypothetical protein